MCSIRRKAEIKIKYYPDNANFYSYIIESSNNAINNLENNTIVEGIIKVYLNDSSAGQNAKQPKAKFISNWKQLYSQAIIIE